MCILTINRAALLLFEEKIRESKNPGLEYALGRGLTEEVIRKHHLGYDNGQIGAALLREFSKEELIQAGLIGEKDGRLYDFFNGRLIFPVMNEKGEPVGFGGRALFPGAKQKYMNSLENELFHKRECLYGIEFLKDGPVILCEGYMDVIALQRVGYNSVATLGTALTEEHLSRLAGREILLAFDSDEAGLNAYQRAEELIGRKCQGISYFPYKDADETLKKGGTAGLRNCVEHAKAHSDFLIQSILKNEGRADGMEKIATVLMEEYRSFDLYGEVLERK